uniref:Transcription initiation factor TFIID subunit 9 n=2 Tax=Clytia hemisphaerica TaxID=252671 RepID=A0A7M5X9J3_9CNID
MASILKEMGVNEYEPRVINQMIEFSYRYITDVIEDARVYSQHANRKNLNLDDVKLAVTQKLDHSFTSPPPREFLLEIARSKNSSPLPLITDRSGLRLPPERYCLTGTNYKVKGLPKKAQSHSRKQAQNSDKSGKSTKTSTASSNKTALTSTLAATNIPLQSPSIATKGTFPTQAAIIPSLPKGINPSNKGITPSNKGITNLLKRKHEGDDDDYDA